MVVDEQFKQNVGKRLKELRKKSKLTIGDLLEILQNEHYVDIDEKSIRRYEKGEFLPKIDNLICLAEIFNTSLDYIIYGRETSDDNSFTYYDNFKRLNRLIYSLSVNFVKNESTGKCYLELWDEESKIYWERLNNFGINDNYKFEKRNAMPKFSLRELDLLIEDFAEYKEQLLPTKKRFDAWLKSQGINPDAFLMEKLNRLKKD
ncbi:MAG: helix-turn-helix transcriptional regulator [Clostridiales bacterium]|nr:helix-turn-helix transcriptional regulator [Clostridiales bacterium]